MDEIGAPQNPVVSLYSVDQTLLDTKQSPQAFWGTRIRPRSPSAGGRGEPLLAPGVSGGEPGLLLRGARAWGETLIIERGRNRGPKAFPAPEIYVLSKSMLLSLYSINTQGRHFSTLHRV